MGVYAELAVGLGETLASASQPGLPYKLSGGEVRGFANYSHALKAKTSKTVDYSEEVLSCNPVKLQSFAAHFATIGSFIEEAYAGVPQDIEGALVKMGSELKVVLVQTRTQI